MAKNQSPWTPAEIEFLWLAYCEGAQDAHIGRPLGRSMFSVAGKRKLLGLRSRRRGRPRKARSNHILPVVRQLLNIIDGDSRTNGDLCQLAGVSHNWISVLRRRVGSPRVAPVTYLAEVLGYELVLRRKDDPQP